MKYRRIPRTDIKVSEIGFAVSEMAASLPGHADTEQVRRLLLGALDLGLTLFTVTDVIDLGESERLLGAALGRRRKDAVIAARGGYDWYKPEHLRREGKIEQDWSPDFVRKACEGTLMRLKMDYVDLYLLHYPGMRALESEGLFEELKDLRREGKIREWGVHLGPGLDWDEEGEMSVKERKAAAVQATYNVLRQKPVRLLFPLAEQYESGIIADDSLAAGLLDHFPEQGAPIDPRLRELDFLRKHYQLTLAQAALKFSLDDAAVASTLISPAKAERLQELAAASDLPPMDAEDVQQLRDLYDAGFGIRR